MKKLVLITLLSGLTMTLKAQEARTYSDEELTKYASVMVWAEEEKERMTGVYNNWINNNDDLNAPRFLDIKKAKGDSVKLLEIEATELELSAYSKILTDYDSMTTAFKAVYVGKIKEDIGAGLYNTLKKDLKSDDEVKGRYEAIVSALKEEAESGESDDQ